MADVFSNPLEIVHPPFQSIETLSLQEGTVGLVSNPKGITPVPLVGGEWLTMFGGGVIEKLSRATSGEAEPMLFVGELGMTDMQASAEKKGPIALERPRIIKTKVISGASALAAGEEVMVGNVTYNSQTRAGLVKMTGAGVYVVGKVISVGTNTGDPDGSWWKVLLYNQPRLTP